MMTEVQAGRYTVRGQSLGGMYTSLHVPQLDAVLDVGCALRPMCSARNLFLSHAHVDHIGSLPALLGMRALCGVRRPLRVFLPEEIAPLLPAALTAFGAMHRYPLEVELVGMAPGDEVEVRQDLRVRAFRTLHPVPSLGYIFLRRVKKLRAEFADLPGPEIGRRRRAGEDLFYELEHLELAYATDTLPEVLDRTPELALVRTLVMECTFLDDRKSLEAARKGCHVHLEELLPRLGELRNEALVLMHFSQLYKPQEVRALLSAHWPEGAPPVIPLVPDAQDWWS